jgi:hypothetical protein
MQRLVATILLSLLCFVSMVPGMDMREVGKVSALVDHYRHHVTEHHETNLSFVDFLVLHYGQSQQGSDDDHSGLPLFGCHPSTPTVSGPTDPPLITAPDPVDMGRAIVLPISEGSPENRPADVFQPPKEQAVSLC